ncbi:MAG: thioredoxin domain-containing protein [Gammaproteobacteria bacterium]
MNRLQHESSPYLREHAEDPVDWHPWDAEALALAQRESKPILLSIGYSANMRCRKMARESFENKKVADFMNENYLNILVDREERPDIDRIYQNAQQLLNRQPGGWPLTMFLDPDDQLPLFGGTYFPPQQTRNQPSFRDVLSGITKTFGKQNDKMQEFKSKMREALAPATPDTVDGEYDPMLIDRACGQIDSSFDAQYGGFAEEPKLPHPAGLEMMLDAMEYIDESVKSDRLAHMLDYTLLTMSRGGLYDHLGGGFFGRAIDREWDIPDFEKLLSDNGALLSVYARRAVQTGSTWFRAVATDTADWMIREMQLEHGGFAASQAADVDGDEGRFYLWLRDDVAAALGNGYEAFAAAYGLDRRANFGLHWHLRLAAPDPESWRVHDEPPAFAAARSTLFDVRAGRMSAGRDEQVVAAWNALAIRGLADAGRHLDRSDYLDAATRAVDYLREKHFSEGRLLATTNAGSGRQTGTVDDYAALIDALLHLLAARWRDVDLEFALGLADAMLANFEDQAGGGFFLSAHDQAPLIQRLRLFGDDTLPAGNGNAALGLQELGILTGESRYLEAAERTLRAGVAEAEGWPSAHATLMRALMDVARPARRVIVRSGNDGSAAGWRAAADEKLGQRGRCYVVPADSTRFPGDGATSASIAVSGSFDDAVSDLDAFEAALG